MASRLSPDLGKMFVGTGRVSERSCGSLYATSLKGFKSFRWNLLVEIFFLPCTIFQNFKIHKRMKHSKKKNSFHFQRIFFCCFQTIISHEPKKLFNATWPEFKQPTNKKKLTKKNPFPTFCNPTNLVIHVYITKIKPEYREKKKKILLE